MKIHLKIIGDEVGLVFDKQTLDEVNFTGDCEFASTVEDDALVIKRVNNYRIKALDDSDNID